jgi:hypothetical protein
MIVRLFVRKTAVILPCAETAAGEMKTRTNEMTVRGGSGVTT